MVASAAVVGVGNRNRGMGYDPANVTRQAPATRGGPAKQKAATPDGPGTVRNPLCCSIAVPLLLTGEAGPVSRSYSDEADHRCAGSGSERRLRRRLRWQRRHQLQGHREVSSRPSRRNPPEIRAKRVGRSDGRPSFRFALHYARTHPAFPHDSTRCRRAPDPHPRIAFRADPGDRRLRREPRTRQEQGLRPPQHGEEVTL